MTYFSEIVAALDRIDLKLRNNSHYVPRNVWFYSYLLQRYEGSVRVSTLRKLIGAKFADEIDGEIGKAPKELVSRVEDEDGNFSYFLLAQEFILDITKHFPIEYALQTSIDNADGMTGSGFIRRINKLKEEDIGALVLDISGFLSHTMGTRFRAATPAAARARLSRDDDDIVKTLRVIESPNRITTVSWKFLLCVYPYLGALDRSEIFRLCNVLRRIASEEGNCPVLLLSSSVNASHTSDVLGNDDQVHFMWAFSALNLLRSVKPLIEQFGDSAVATFPAIFKSQHQPTLSAKVSVTNWEEAAKLHNKQNGLSQSQSSSISAQITESQHDVNTEEMINDTQILVLGYHWLSDTAIRKRRDRLFMRQIESPVLSNALQEQCEIVDHVWFCPLPQDEQMLRVDEFLIKHPELSEPIVRFISHNKN